jgi:hypothetical protein
VYLMNGGNQRIDPAQDARSVPLKLDRCTHTVSK